MRAASAPEPLRALATISSKASGETFSILSIAERTGIINSPSTPMLCKKSAQRVLSPRRSLNSLSVSPNARSDSIKSAITSASAPAEPSPRMSALYW